MVGRLGLRRRVGFTLIELLIVVAIIGILAAIAIPNLLQAQRRAKNSSAASDTRNIVAQALVYIHETNSLPPSVNVLYDGTAPGGTSYMARAEDPWNKPNDYQFEVLGAAITGEVRAWSVGSVGGTPPFRAPGTVGFSNYTGEYDFN